MIQTISTKTLLVKTDHFPIRLLIILSLFLISKRTPFHDPGRTIVKTMTMTTGEFEFDRVFRQDNSTEVDDIQYGVVSYTLWILFLILMPILLTNLLVRR